MGQQQHKGTTFILPADRVGGFSLCERKALTEFGYIKGTTKARELRLGPKLLDASMNKVREILSGMPRNASKQILDISSKVDAIYKDIEGVLFKYNTVFKPEVRRLLKQIRGQIKTASNTARLLKQKVK
jgi:hypothetical protein